VETQQSIGAKFRRLWKYYVIQSLLAAFVLCPTVLILGPDKMVVASAIGATAFIVFAMPKSISAQRRNVVGGHLVGLASGAVFYFLKMPHPLAYALAVALTIFLMVALDVEHPPAAGTALAVVINQVTLDAILTIMACALILSQCRHYLRHRLRDLV